MSSVTSLRDPASIARLEGPPSASPFDGAVIARQAPDLHLALGKTGTECRARCSLWWTQPPAYGDHTVGLIGHYAATDEQAARGLLDQACQRLREKGCTIAIGPMDGATWYTYRFITEWGDRPPFVLEPCHPPSYPEHFHGVGFEPLAHYVSSLGADLASVSVPGPPPRQDVSVRPLDLDQYDDELRRLYALATESFARNFLYTPIAEADFRALYQPLHSIIEPSLVRLLEQERGDERRLVGMAVLLPDVTQAERGEAIDTVVFKTLAVHPELTGQGLGGWLVNEAHHVAQEHGYRRALHALMHEDNRSRRFGQGDDSVIRRYALFARSLA